MNIKRQEGPARPSMETAQSMQTKNLRREDLPEEMGMLRSEWRPVNGHELIGTLDSVSVNG
jgi:hypothetical protein